MGPATAAAILASSACTGKIGEPLGDPAAGGPGSAAGTGTGNATGTSGTVTGTGGAGTTSPPNPMGTDPGTIPMHRLNAFEYDNTVNALFGLTQRLAEDTFIPDEKGTTGFDNEAGALTMSAAEYQQYFNAADALAEQVFASPASVAKVVTCTPPSASDATCLRSILDAFGLRAYRRPLFADEVARFQKLAADAVAAGEDFKGSVKQVVKMMLSSIPFLYRLELDPVPDSTTPHPVEAYELASRLSYLFWSGAPDDALFGDARSGMLPTDATLQQEVDRMLRDPRASNFISSFAGQWLGVRDLKTHQIEPTAFPTWTEPLRQAMMQEQLLYFDEFLTGSLPWTQFLTAPVNFVNGPLAVLYGAKNIPATQTTMTKVAGLDPNRIGYMGLAGFLTQSSYSYRTVPTLRGKWVLQNILGESVPAPPPGIPPLDDKAAASDAMTQEQNVRARLEAHRANPSCAACHTGLDPIGLGLENFNGIGAYRSAYGNGQAIDASGRLPDGATFQGIVELAGILSKGDRQSEIASCAVERLMAYALSRALNLNAPADSDQAYVTQVTQKWPTQGYAFKALLQDVVESDTFRLRHGGS